jgi:ferredoxin
VADFRLVVEENSSDGPFFVDETCIACDTCVGISSLHFQLTLDSDHAYVIAQPQTEGDRQKCREALAKCPVQAIGELE